MIRLIIGCLLGVFFIGCTSTNTSMVTYEEYKPKKNIVQETKRDKIEIFSKVEKKETQISGSIKGSVITLKKSGNLWYYEIKSENTSNNKLSSVKFKNTKKVANKGDFVYAIIDNGRLKDIYLIKKANYKRKIVKNKKQHISKKYKRTKKQQVLGVPTVESISLD